MSNLTIENYYYFIKKKKPGYDRYKFICCHLIGNILTIKFDAIKNINHSCAIDLTKDEINKYLRSKKIIKINDSNL